MLPSLEHHPPRSDEALGKRRTTSQPPDDRVETNPPINNNTNIVDIPTLLKLKLKQSLPKEEERDQGAQEKTRRKPMSNIYMPQLVQPIAPGRSISGEIQPLNFYESNKVAGKTKTIPNQDPVAEQVGAETEPIQGEDASTETELTKKVEADTEAKTENEGNTDIQDMHTVTDKEDKPNEMVEEKSEKPEIEDAHMEEKEMEETDGQEEDTDMAEKPVVTDVQEDDADMEENLVITDVQEADTDMKENSKEIEVAAGQEEDTDMEETPEKLEITDVQEDNADKEDKPEKLVVTDVGKDDADMEEKTEKRDVTDVGEDDADMEEKPEKLEVTDVQEGDAELEENPEKLKLTDVQEDDSGMEEKSEKLAVTDVGKDENEEKLKVTDIPEDDAGIEEKAEMLEVTDGGIEKPKSKENGNGEAGTDMKDTHSQEADTDTEEKSEEKLEDGTDLKEKSKKEAEDDSGAQDADMEDMPKEIPEENEENQCGQVDAFKEEEDGKSEENGCDGADTDMEEKPSSEENDGCVEATKEEKNGVEEIGTEGDTLKSEENASEEMGTEDTALKSDENDSEEMNIGMEDNAVKSEETDSEEVSIGETSKKPWEVTANGVDERIDKQLVLEEEEESPEENCSDKNDDIAGDDDVNTKEEVGNTGATTITKAESMNVPLKLKLRSGYACTFCSKTLYDDKMVRCKLCKQHTHIYCMNPPMNELPEWPWKCEKCMRKQQSRCSDVGVASVGCQTEDKTSLYIADESRNWLPMKLRNKPKLAEMLPVKPNYRNLPWRNPQEEAVCKKAKCGKSFRKEQGGFGYCSIQCVRTDSGEPMAQIPRPPRPMRAIRAPPRSNGTHGGEDWEASELDLEGADITSGSDSSIQPPPKAPRAPKAQRAPTREEMQVVVGTPEELKARRAAPGFVTQASLGRKPGKGFKFCHACDSLVANRRRVCNYCFTPNPSSRQAMKRAAMQAGNLDPLSLISVRKKPRTKRNITASRKNDE